MCRCRKSSESLRIFAFFRSQYTVVASVHLLLTDQNYKCRIIQQIFLGDNLLIFFQGRATGNKPALWIRCKLQEELYQLGKLIQEHAGKVLFTGLLVLAALSIGLKSVVMEDRIEKLWVEQGGRLDRELKYVEDTLGKDYGGINQMLIQTSEDGAMLTSESLLAHLDVLKEATRVHVEMDDM